jgi:hypothetical protein
MHVRQATARAIPEAFAELTKHCEPFIQDLELLQRGQVPCTDSCPQCRRLLITHLARLNLHQPPTAPTSSNLTT